MHYLLSHRTTYTYASTVDSAHHIAHLRARDFPGQKVSAIGIVTSPLPALAVQHVDHFGNLIDIYRIDKPHTRFDIEVRAEVDVSFPEPPAAASTPAWEDIRESLFGDGFPVPVEASEFIHDSPLVPSVEALRDYGAQSFTAGRPILEAARELTSRIKADFEYHPGATDISTPLGDVFAGKAGVCQDFAHIFISVARHLGLPARYISGYMLDEGDMKAASHAWAEAHIQGLGWVGFDPANDICPDERYVRVASGLDYSDTAPVSGMRIGTAPETITVAVSVEQ